MKHLKSYKLFESVEEDMSNVKDIFLDLEDKDFSINISKFSIGDGFSISMIYPNYGSEVLDFKLSDVIDCVRRSNEYMSSLGYKVSYAHSTPKGGSEIPQDINDWNLDMYVIYLAVFYNKICSPVFKNK
jgi:hypothetical protein